MNALTPLAPLHQPQNLAPIRALRAMRLGLAQVADLEKLSAKLDRFATKAETLRRRTTDITALKKAAKDAERAQAKMEKRVAKLEKSVLDLSKKLAAAKAKKAPAAKKPATKKTPSKSRTAKK